jgi:hypothetical protein
MVPRSVSRASSHVNEGRDLGGVLKFGRGELRKALEDIRPPGSSKKGGERL